jgi:hypothetical protein
VSNQGGIRSAAMLGFDIPKQALMAMATAVALMVDGARMPVYLAMQGRDVLEQRRSLELTYESVPASERPPQLVLHIAEQAWASSDVQELADLLCLVKGKRLYPLTSPTVIHEASQPYEELVVETRSLLGILFFLSQAVEVPWYDRQGGKVATTRNETGQPFDWQQVVGGLLAVKVLPAWPSQASVVIRYQGGVDSIPMIPIWSPKRPSCC